jgi:hypothetical protein
MFDRNTKGCSTSYDVWRATSRAALRMNKKDKHHDRERGRPRQTFWLLLITSVSSVVSSS